jgi:adenosylmethionine-8-amino-7-oxononanoate aminotransferase
MALGVTAATQKIFDAFLSDDRNKTFFHGHSFTANPIACSSALASLDLLEKEDCKKNVETLVGKNTHFISSLTDDQHATIRKMRQLGTILAFEINSGVDSYLNSITWEITQKALQNGIYLRPLGNTVYIMPPYCITQEESNTVYQFLGGLMINKQ